MKGSVCASGMLEIGKGVCNKSQTCLTPNFVMECNPKIPSSVEYVGDQPILQRDQYIKANKTLSRVTQKEASCCLARPDSHWRPVPEDQITRENSDDNEEDDDNKNNISIRPDVPRQRSPAFAGDAAARGSIRINTESECWKLRLTS